MAKRNVQGVPTVHTKPGKKPDVQKQIRAIQKRLKALEYDIISIRMKTNVKEPRQIGYAQQVNLHSDNEFD